WPLKPGVNDLRLVSTRAGRKSAQTLRVTRTVPRALPASPTFIEATSVTPRTDLEFWDSAADTPAERSVQVSFRGSPGGTA
ncbi:UNVERIFIED_CONTAM: N-acetylmuramoyl-L-alanine amidase, partial [Bacteroidetes bacterium 56_B9]